MIEIYNVFNKISNCKLLISKNKINHIIFQIQYIICADKNDMSNEKLQFIVFQ